MSKHNDFYTFVASCLTAKMEEQTITTTQLASRVGEQYNTINGIMQGRRFYAHHVAWINDFLSYDVAQVYVDSINGDQSEQKESGLSAFI